MSKGLNWNNHANYCHMRQAIEKDRDKGFVFMASVSSKGKKQPAECQCKSGFPIIAVLPVNGRDIMKGFCKRCKP